MQLELTELELESLIYLVEQKHLIKGKHKTAVKNAVKKITKKLSRVRRKKIFDAGVLAAKMLEAPGKCPLDLGCMQQMTWYDGYCSINKAVKNPYRG